MRTYRTIFGAALALMLVTAAAAAQSPSTGGAGAATPRLDDRSDAKLLEDLLRTVEALQQKVDRQDHEIADLRRQMAQAAAAASSASASSEGIVAAAPQSAPVAAPPVASPAASQDAQSEQHPQRVPELPPDAVTPGDFPGSVKIPGSDAALKIGGLVRINWVSTNDALLVQDRFATSAIPVQGTTDAGRGARVDVIASPSRFYFDLRTPTGVGHMRSFIEGDFAGDNGGFRLRHAYGQWRRVIFGQTWSTFSDPEAEPDGIDFEGLNAIVLFRQPQIRWSVPINERTRIAFALEDPKPDLTGAASVSQAPDVIARVRFEPHRGGHVQLAGIYRRLRGEPEDRANEVVGATGYGISFSGRLPSPVWKDRDQLLFQHNIGAGIGRYITDLSTAGGQDGVYNTATQELEVLNAYSGYIGYEHWWTARIRSAFSFGIVGVTNLDIQPDDALHLTRRYSANVMWSPIPRLDLVTEFLFGSRVNKDGRSGSAAQTQIGSTFRF